MNPGDQSLINRLDIEAVIRPNDEKIEVTYDNLYTPMSEDDFAQAVDQQISRANAYWDGIRLRVRQEVNYKYWVGDQINKSDLRDDLEKWAENVIFRNVEALLPIVTSRTPELSVVLKYKNDRTRKYSQDVRRMLRTEWEITQEMQPKVTRGVRNHQLNFIAIFQLGYDPDTQEFWTEEIPANQVVISKDGKFIARYIKDQTLGDVLDRFPKKKVEILSHVGLNPDMEVTKQMRSSPAEYVEAWMDDVVGWKMGTLVLGVEPNPHWDRTGQEYEVLDEATQSVVKNKVYFNHLKQMKKPFLFITYYNRGVQVYDDTTLVEQSIGLQDWINKRKRQIGANADSTNGHWVTSGDFISQEEFEKLTGGIDEKIWLSKGLPRDGFIKLTGQPLPDYIYTDLIDSRQSLNSLMGIENATLGAPTNNKTATQDLMQRQQNFGRADGYVRDGIEQFAKHWFDYMYHLYLVYQKDEMALAIPEDDDIESENLVFSRSTIPVIKRKNGDMMPCPLIFRIKQGSTLPEDEVAEYQKIQQVANLLSPIDLLSKLGYANPRQLTKNALLWQKDPMSFFQNDPDIQAMLQKEAAAKQQAELAAKAAPPPSLPTSGSNGEMTPPSDGTTDKGVGNAMRAMIESGEVPMPGGMG